MDITIGRPQFIALICFVAASVSCQASTHANPQLVVSASGTPAKGVEERQRGTAYKAVAFYYRANLLYTDTSRHVNPSKIDWLFDRINESPNDLPIDDVREFLNKIESSQLLANLEIAASCSDIEWPWIHESAERKFLMHAFHEFSNLRTLGSVVDLNARLNLANQDFDSAVQHMQVHLAMAGHLIGHPDFFHSDQGIVIAENALKTIEEFIQQPDSPNLYWFLSLSLREFTNSRLIPSIKARRKFFDSLFPSIRDWESQDLDVQDTGQRFRKFVDSLGQENSNVLSIDTTVVAELSADSRKNLIQTGLSEEFVSGMSELQAVVLDRIFQIRMRIDHLESLLKIEFDDAETNVLVTKVANDLHSLEVSMDMVLTGGYLTNDMNEIPNFAKRFSRYMAVKQRMEMLRLIESVRFHAKLRDGKIPESLQKLDKLNVPLDPATMRPFVYSVDRNTVQISSDIDGSLNKQTHQELGYSISLRDSKKGTGNDRR